MTRAFVLQAAVGPLAPRIKRHDDLAHAWPSTSAWDERPATMGKIDTTAMGVSAEAVTNGARADRDRLQARQNVVAEEQLARQRYSQRVPGTRTRVTAHQADGRAEPTGHCARTWAEATCGMSVAMSKCSVVARKCPRGGE